MNPNDRARLTNALRDHVAKIAADLRAKMRARGPSRAAAVQLHTDERVAEDFEVWTDLLSRRASVLWVLKSVYVRVLEDRGLLSPGRLLDPEAQQLFERLAQNLGETAFLRWIYRDLASHRGGLPELFSPQPAEVALPSDDLSRALIEFWRHRDADTGAVWSFAEEHFEGELMGDLYQELDPVVKDRFALCQTPDFVRAFILDRTLSPAIETFGADEVRLLDPACGSGHFLIDGLKRLVAATATKHRNWDRAKVVAHALDRVVGVDLNDYACALARTRLIMTAAELAGVTKLADAARFHPHVYWADGLEQIEREEQKPSVQYALFEKIEEKPRATLTRSDVRAALQKVFASRFHVVVANPPYITESDDARKQYHTEKIGQGPRYVSAYKHYHLSGPFIERCFQLACPKGRIGVIVDNQFMRRDYGVPLIEEVLAGKNLFLVVDTSLAHIPHHGTPTVLLFCTNEPPLLDTIRVVANLRKESATPRDPATAPTWSAIVAHAEDDSYADTYISVQQRERAQLQRHEWNLSSDVALSLQSRIEAAGTRKLNDFVADVGRTTHTSADPIYYLPTHVARRIAPAEHYVPLIRGEDLRDWAVLWEEACLFPYSQETATAEPPRSVNEITYYRRYRTLLRGRRDFGKTMKERGLQWFEHSMFFPARYRSLPRLTWSESATHNHFALVSARSVGKQSAPGMTLRDDVEGDCSFLLLGLMNSSVACFWMKQVFQSKGATSANRNHPDPERLTYGFSATRLMNFPVPTISAPDRRSLEALARSLDALARERTECVGADAWTPHLSTAASLRTALSARWERHDRIRQRQIHDQEELDWLVYKLYGLAQTWIRSSGPADGRVPRGGRAFELLKGRKSFVRERGKPVPPALAEVDTAPCNESPQYSSVREKRCAAMQADESLDTLEAYLFKRLWRDSEDNVCEVKFRDKHDRAQLKSWLCDRLEVLAQGRSEPFTLGRLAAALLDDREVQAVAEVVAGSASFSLERVLLELLAEESVPQHPCHIYTESGLAKHEAWEEVWSAQRREDAGDAVPETDVELPEFSQGSRGKTTDYLRASYWKLRGECDVPRERFVAFTEVPGRTGAETLYGWAGWTPAQRLKAILAVDEQLEDSGTPLGDRIGLLDSAWRLLPDVVHEDAGAATRLRAELRALVGPDGPSRELIADWSKRFPPPTARATRAKRAVAKHEIEDSSTEETDES